MSLVGYSPWSLKESDVTEQLSVSLFQGKYSELSITKEKALKPPYKFA